MARKRQHVASERELIAELERQLAPVRGPQVALGIGDDAALLRLASRAGQRLVVSVDDQVEGVHFDLRWLDLADVGFRALQAAASDLAAMGAKPLGAVASLHLPRGFTTLQARQLARGQAEAARLLGCPVVGGNIARGPALSVTTTVLGTAQKPLLRAGARPGDELWVVGELGWARAGLLLHQRRTRVPTRLAAAVRHARRAFARPAALLADGARLVGRARAMLDVSDGLSGDVQRLAEAAGVRAVIEAGRLAALVPSDLAELGDVLGEPGVALALTGGEDYALLCAGPRARRPSGAKVVGRIERGSGAVLELDQGQRFALGPGFDHLRA